MTFFEETAAETLRRWIGVAQKDAERPDGKFARSFIKQCCAALSALEAGDGRAFVREVSWVYLDQMMSDSFRRYDLEQRPKLSGAKKRGKTKRDTAAVIATFAELTEAARRTNRRVVQKPIIADIAKRFEISESTVRRYLPPKGPFDSS
jgi:hypothetical protein